MAKESAKAFLEELQGNKELQEKLNAADKAYTGDAADRKAALEDILLPIAKEAGYDLTAEDVLALRETSGELGDDELEAVAGGSKGFCLLLGFGFADGEAFWNYDLVDEDVMELGFIACRYVGVGKGHKSV